MELLATIKALQAMTQRCTVTLYTDSAYVARGISEGWALRWRENGWWIAANKPAKIPDLWAELLRLLDNHSVNVRWVKGHDSVPENKRADQLAGAAAEVPVLPPDEVYELQQLEPQRASVPDGHPCFKCKTPVLKRTSQKRFKPGQTYYFEWILYCPGCHTVYIIEEAKRAIDRGPELNL